MHSLDIRMLFAMLAALAVTIAMPSVALGGNSTFDDAGTSSLVRCC